MMDAFAQVDMRGRIKEFNEAFQKMLGYEPQEIYRLSYKALTPEKWHTVETGIIETQVLTRGYSDIYGKEYRRKDGIVIPVELRTFLMRDNAGNPFGMWTIVRDISNTEKESVKLLHRQLEFILGVTKTGLDIIDPGFNIRYIDPEWQKVYGDPAGKKCHEYFMNRNEVCPGCGIVEALRTKQKAVTEEILLKEGNRPIQVTSLPFQNEHGEWLIAEVNVDISERKRAEEALRESKDYLNTIINSITDPIFVKDRKHRFVLVNDAECALAGHTREELLGKTDYDFFLKEQVDVFWEKDEEVFETGKENINEETITDARGNIRTIVTKKTLYIDKAGNKFIVGIIRDISDRKQAEEAIRESETKFRILAEELSAGVYVSQDRILKYVNPQLARIFGYSARELIGKKDFQDLVHPEDYPLLEKTRPKILSQEEKPVSSEIRGIQKNKEIRVLEVFRSRTIYEGKPAITGVVLDITERKIAENKIRSYQEQIWAMATEISMAEERERRHIAEELHDNIIQVLAMVNVKLGQLRKNLSSAVFVESLDQIRELVQRTTEDIRTLTFELSPPVLYDLGLEAAVEWLADEMQKKNPLSMSVRDDKRQKPLNMELKIFLFKAVRELLINIVKHARAHTVKIGMEKDGRKIKIGIIDDGLGFEVSGLHEYAEKVGGFGLFNIRERIGHFGGTMEIESAIGAGTKVTLAAPLESSRRKSKSKNKKR